MKDNTSTKGYLDMELLRFTTAGSVDDGKSTLIGRLLYDSKQIFEDQLEAVEKASKRGGGEGEVNLALLTDGLRSEREQGITIDVAYRYFATPKRKFIIADTPGHIQYTRNMVTGASTANLAVILVDARHGLVEQTARHSFIASLLGIKHVVYCINKMDLVNYSEKVFEGIKTSLEEFTSKLEIGDIQYIPISALFGDNVVDRSEQMPWYNGSTLLETLETLHIASDQNLLDGRFPVQCVIHPDRSGQQTYAGRIAGGVFKKGDEVTVLPSGAASRIAQIIGSDGVLTEAFAPMSCAFALEDGININRGDMIVKPDNPPNTSQHHKLMICWMSKRPLELHGHYALKHTTQDTRCTISAIDYKVDINSLEPLEGQNEVGMNDIARIAIETSSPLFTDNYQRNRNTGSVILIDEANNETVGAGMLL